VWCEISPTESGRSRRDDFSAGRDLDHPGRLTVRAILPESGELLREVSRIAFDPSLAPDDALRRIRDLLREHDQSEGGLR
jgi:hypothetical protein